MNDTILNILELAVKIWSWFTEERSIIIFLILYYTRKAYSKKAKWFGIWADKKSDSLSAKYMTIAFDVAMWINMPTLIERLGPSLLFHALRLLVLLLCWRDISKIIDDVVESIEQD